MQVESGAAAKLWILGISLRASTPNYWVSPGADSSAGGWKTWSWEEELCGLGFTADMPLYPGAQCYWESAQKCKIQQTGTTNSALATPSIMGQQTTGSRNINSFKIEGLLGRARGKNPSEKEEIQSPQDRQELPVLWWSKEPLATCPQRLELGQIHLFSAGSIRLVH